MNNDTQTNGPIMNGDDELAKTLAGGLKFEETPPSSGVSAPAADTTSDDTTPPSMDDMLAPAAADDQKDEEPAKATDERPADDRADDDASTSDNPELDQIKSSALDDLKPLVGKLNLSPEEKFDTLLLIIRSTDDQALLAEAHEAAKNITDDTKRAEALLDVIKEVDYFKGKKD